MNSLGSPDDVATVAPAGEVLVIAKHRDRREPGWPTPEPGEVALCAGDVVPLVARQDQQIRALARKDRERPLRGGVRLGPIHMKIRHLRDREPGEGGRQVRNEERHPSDTHIVLGLGIHDRNGGGNGGHGTGGKESAAGDRAHGGAPSAKLMPHSNMHIV
jgi:hypothetical protein